MFSALLLSACLHVGSGTDHTVGPGQTHATPSDVNWNALQAGDTVRIHWRAQPYRDKVMISSVGTEAQPIRVCGVRGPQGQRPVLDGQDATTRPDLDFPFDGHQPRGLIIVGNPHSDYFQTPAHVIIEGLELRNAHRDHTYTDKAGVVQQYAWNASCIFAPRSHDMTLRDLDVHHCGNGLFLGHGSGPNRTERLRIVGNHIHHNGVAGRDREHNAYLEGIESLVEFNHFGPTVGNGSGLKDRGSTTIRYNFVAGGAHLLDIVDAQETPENASDPALVAAFRTTHVYGNVFVQRRSAGGMFHYGGDSGVFDKYRKGVLQFYNNTVVVQNCCFDPFNEQDVFELSTDAERLEASNNIFWSTHPVAPLSPIIFIGSRNSQTPGVANFVNNLIPPDWHALDPTPYSGTVITAVITGLDASYVGDPGFADPGADDYRVSVRSLAWRAGAWLPQLPPVVFEYVLHRRGQLRNTSVPPTLGALTVRHLTQFIARWE